jgi:hypothetical protein
MNMEQMENTRAPRALKTRESAERPKSWAPPQLLPDPTPEAGYAYRWIRISTMNQADPRNISGKLREGWEPVKAADHPEIRLFGENDTRFPDAVIVGGLMLCKTPAEFVDQRNSYYGNQTETQMQSVDNSFMREGDARMPLFKERKSTVTFGKGI